MLEASLTGMVVDQARPKMLFENGKPTNTPTGRWRVPIFPRGGRNIVFVSMTEAQAQECVPGATVTVSVICEPQWVAAQSESEIEIHQEVVEID